jgi:predicted ATPase
MPVPRRPPFAGRDGEIAELSELRARAEAGEGTLVLVSGEAGVGKTRLAEELATQHAGSALALWGRCIDSPAAPPYLPWLQVTRELRRSLGADAFAALATPQQHEEIIRGLPELQPGSQPVEPPAGRYGFFDAMSALLRGAAARRPLLIVLDDLHWADEPTLLLLGWLAADLRGAAILAVGIYREDPLPADHALHRLVGSAARDAMVPLHVGGLQVPALAALARAAGVDDADALAEQLERRTGGNPFFTIETLRLLASDPLAGAQVPEGAAALLNQRLAPLSPECRGLLDAAAVAGDFSLDILSGAPASRARGTPL